MFKTFEEQRQIQRWSKWYTRAQHLSKDYQLKLKELHKVRRELQLLEEDIAQELRERIG
jgi:DNA-binding ferritin-like protein (Dps family)